MQFLPGIPIYKQLIEEMKGMIISQTWQSGTKIPSVRELSQTFGVNPNTMQKSLVALEQEGLLFAERTAGRYVTNDKELIDKLKKDQAFKIAAKSTQKLLALGLNPTEITELVRLVFEKGEQNESDCNHNKSQ